MINQNLIQACSLGGQGRQSSEHAGSLPITKTRPCLSTFWGITGTSPRICSPAVTPSPQLFLSPWAEWQAALICGHNCVTTVATCSRVPTALAPGKLPMAKGMATLFLPWAGNDHYPEDHMVLGGKASCLATACTCFYPPPLRLASLTGLLSPVVEMSERFQIEWQQRPSYKRVKKTIKH